MPENGGSEGQKRTKTQILCSKSLKSRFRRQKRTKIPFLCSGMVAGSSAALPRALRGASGSSTPGNRLPQPTTQPAVVHAPGQPTRWHTTVSKQPGYLLPLIPPWRYSRGTAANSYRRHACRRACCRNLPPCMLPQPAAKTYLPGTLPAAKTYLPLILPCILPQSTCRGILPRDGSSAQWAGDSDVGANDKGAGDDPGDWVDAH